MSNLENKQNDKLLAGRYQVIKKIGAGGTANVFLGYDTQKEIKVALKVERDVSNVSSSTKRFKLEADQLMQYKNRNIVRVYDFVLYKGKGVIVMEYLNGKTLEDILKEKGKLKNETAIKYILQILNALKDIHANKVFHRDLKPSNLMVGFDNELKLADFGIVLASEDQDLTTTGNFIGSVKYAAPELFKNSRASQKSEIYAIGVILYEMLTGVPPFNGTSAPEIASKHVHESPSPLINIVPDLDIKLNNIVLRCLEKDDFDRYATVSELDSVLRDYLDSNSLTTKEIKNLSAKPLHSKMPRNSIQENKLLFIILGVIGIIALIAIIVAITM